MSDRGRAHGQRATPRMIDIRTVLRAYAALACEGQCIDNKACRIGFRPCAYRSRLSNPVDRRRSRCVCVFAEPHRDSVSFCMHPYVQDSVCKRRLLLYFHVNSLLRFVRFFNAEKNAEFNYIETQKNMCEKTLKYLGIRAQKTKTKKQKQQTRKRKREMYQFRPITVVCARKIIHTR